MGFRRRLMMAQRQGGGRVLPAGYTPLLYLQGRMSSSWINTGISASSNIRIKCKCQLNSNPTGYAFIFGVRDSDEAHRLELYSYTSYINACTFTGYSGYTSNNDFGIQEYDISQERIIRNGIEYPNTGERSSWSISTEIYLFALNNNGTSQQASNNFAKIYYLQIFDGNNLVRDYVPAMNANNVLGMYDFVSNTFFTNDGTADFYGQVDYPLDSEGYRPYIWLNGEDAPSGSVWIDRVLRSRWTLTGATHGDDYYEFLNPTSGAATKYAALANAGKIINLGTEWKIEVDAYIDGGSMRYGYMFDMCAYGTTSTNYKGIAFGMVSSTGGVSVSTKPSGNTAITQNDVAGISPITYASGWNLHHYKWICEDDGNTMSIVRTYHEGEERRYTNSFATVGWTDFRNNTSPNTSFFIARGANNTSSTNTAIRGRIKSIKISIKE